MRLYSDCSMPVLPGYDTAVYPHAVAEFRYQAGKADWYEIRLYYSGSAFFYQKDVGCVTNEENVTRWRSFLAATGTWSAEKTRGGSPAVVFGAVDGGFRRLWTNRTLADETGGILLEEGRVSGNDWKGLGSWLSGMVLGLSWVPFRAVQTNAPTIPQSYDYNGVKLDWLPERIAEQAYIVMCYVPHLQRHRVFASVSAGTRFDTDNNYLRSTSSISITYYITDFVNGSWSEVQTQRVSNNSFVTSYAVEPVWSNKNFYTRKGQLYLQGLPPVAVVRKHRVQDCDRKALVLGWKLGQRLALQRNRGDAA